jgi:asparagine synthase (glutamine-hydrolysing)
MCGITGFIGPWDRVTLVEMTDLLRHRGPDDEGFHFTSLRSGEQNIGLGHRRLSIIDLDTGQQPIWNEQKTRGIIFNGEIYNYRQLRSQLEGRGCVFSTQSDTEVILRGYEEFGVRVLEKLEGMFAIAIWDEPEEKLFLARDRIGIKPLYYYPGAHGEISFGSELKALLPLIQERNISKEALYHYLLYGFVLQGESMVEGIHHLLPGHYLIWQNGSFTTQRYWRLQKQDYDAKTEADWMALIEENLRNAVKSHLIADVPVGLTLSGGLDSSAVLALMCQSSDHSLLNAITVGYNRPDDETRYSRIAAAGFDVNVHERFIKIEDVGEHYEKIIYHMEEPIAHPVLGTTYFLSRAVREHLKVVLIGEGSDELFAGYPHYRLFTFPYSLAPEFLTRHFFMKAGYIMPGWRTIANLLQPEWLDRDLLRQVAHRYDPYFSGGITGERGLHFELEAELVGSQLLRVDKLMMAHSVEARVPFLDRNFVELAYSIPYNLKRKNGIEKYILRKAMSKYLPDEVAWRPKSGPKGTQALLQPLMDKALLPRWNDLLSNQSLTNHGMFIPEKMTKYLTERPWDKYDPIRSRGTTKFRLALLTLEIWRQIFCK